MPQHTHLIALMITLMIAPLGTSCAYAQTAPENIPLPIKRPDVTKGGSSPKVPRARPSPSSQPKPTPPSPTSKASPRIYQAACPVVLKGIAVGQIEKPIKKGQCGTLSPFKITGVKLDKEPIALSTPVVMNCAMATAFVDWVEAVDAHIKAQTSSFLTRLNVGTSYACRRRNNKATGKISEHGFANALDVTGFELSDGTKVALPMAWKADDDSQPLIKASHKLACGIFTTVLGPDANPLHYDHLHFDMGCHGKNCTYTLCE